MASVSGACSIDNLSGMVSVREDVTPSTLEWKLIDQKKVVTVPLNSLTGLKALKETVAAMKVRVYYDENGESKLITLTFSNRPIMNNIKEALQVVVNRLRTVVTEGSATPAVDGSSRAGTPMPSTASPAVDSLSDSSLLKNFDLQQKLLQEDRDLRNIFSNSVLKGKLPPKVFWLTRVNLLRTYALTVSQHRGPYNVLSTIKPVATSDNKVNVNVTRETINEIFDTYPVVKRAVEDLVPHKFSEGEFWLRFFNLKLFRRLRGDKINTINNRGDAVLDKYLFMKVDDAPAASEGTPGTSRFIDIQANVDDNSQKLGNAPDMTMRYEEEPSSQQQQAQQNNGRENEMILLMKNMNKLLGKMVKMVREKLPGTQPLELDKPGAADDLSKREEVEYIDELDLHDLNESAPQQYIRLNIHSNRQRWQRVDDHGTAGGPEVDDATITSYIERNMFQPSSVDLRSTYEGREKEIELTNNGINALVKQNHRVLRMLLREKAAVLADATNIVPLDVIQDIITFNITIVELLLHFWKIFLHGNQPTQLKELFKLLKQLKEEIEQFKTQAVQKFKQVELIKDNQKLQDKMAQDLELCLEPVVTGLNAAMDEYVKAVKAYQAAQAAGKGQDLSDTPNANGKRPMVDS